MTLVPSYAILAMALAPMTGTVTVSGGSLFAIVWLVPLLISLVGILVDRDRVGGAATRARPYAPAPRPRRLEPRFARST